MREIQDIPIDKIIVLNPRERDPSKFQENIESIRRVGLKRPIVVNTRFLEESGQYELVCGQGRIEAFKKLKRPEIPALLVDVDRDTALIMSIAENATRHSPQPIWFANVIKGLHDGGMTVPDIAEILGRSKSYVSDYLMLITQGEGILLDAVERGRIGATLAMKIVKTPEPQIQNLLVEAVDAKLVSEKNVGMVRRIIENRKRFTARYEQSSSNQPRPVKTYSLENLRKEIRRTLDKQEDFIQKSRRTENRLMLLASEFQRLHQDAHWLDILHGENLTAFPSVHGPLLDGLFDLMMKGVTQHDE